MRKLLVAVLVLASACGDDGGATPDDAPIIDAPTEDAPVDASCFTNPQTHAEIINACTTAQKIFKDSSPPLLNPDGSLPQLPP